MATNDLPELLTIQEVAAASGYSERSIRNCVYAKPPRHIGRHAVLVGTRLRFPKPAVVAWLNGTLEDAAASETGGAE